MELTMLRALFIAVAAVALVGCAADVGDEEEESSETDSEELTAIDLRSPIALHYGMLQDNAVKGDGPRSSNAKLTDRIRANGVENVLVTNAAAKAPELAGWKGKLAYRATPSEIPTASVAEAAQFFRAKYDAGYAYVAVDEIEPTKAAMFIDARSGPILAGAMRALENEPQNKHRIILYVNSYNMAGSSRERLSWFKDVLTACRDTCRVLASEVYLAASEAFLPGTPTGTNCASGVRCIGFLSQKLDQVAPGISGKTITVLDVRGRLLPGKDARGSYCWGPKGGSLRAEFAKVRALRQPGVGTYALTYVANDLEGPTKAAAYDRAVSDFAGCLRGLVGEARFASPKI